MLFLLFQIGEDWYALDAIHVAEVLPLVKFKPILQAPAGIAGVFNYHGAPVPLIDLSELVAGVPTQARMSTRIVLVDYSADSDTIVKVGLLVEELMETLRCGGADFIDSGTALAPSPYLGPITMDKGRIIHRIELKGLLSGALYDHLIPRSLVVK